jgi:hypothetical protein
MATTYQLISSVTVGSGGAANIQFTSIPATFTDLVVKMSVRCAASSPTRVYVRFNGASTDANLSTIRLFGEATSPGSDSISAGQPAWASGTSTTADIFNNAEFYIPNYLSSNSKSFSADTVQENNSSTQAYLGLFAGLWSSSSAINQINLLMQDSSNFLQHSTAYLYGISNA